MPFNTFQLLNSVAVSLIAFAPAALTQDYSALPAALSQDLATLPKCVVTCTMAAYTAHSQSCSSFSDLPCFCKNEGFLGQAKGCMVASCPPESLTAASAFAAKACGAVGVAGPNFNPSTEASAPAVTASSTAVKGPSNINSTANATLNTAPIPVPEVLEPSVSATQVPASVASLPLVPAPTVPSPAASIPAPKALNSTNATLPSVQKVVTNSTVPKVISSASQSNQSQDSLDHVESSGSSSTQVTEANMIFAMIATFFFIMS